MVNGRQENITTFWIRDYHEPDYGDQSVKGSSVKEMMANCPRCGRVLPTQAHQDLHNTSRHSDDRNPNNNA